MADVVFVKIGPKDAKVWGYDSYMSTGTNWKSVPVRVVYHWGSIGRTMQQLTKKEVEYSTYWNAIDTIAKKVDEKLDKGYWRVLNHVYFEKTEVYRDALEIFKP